MPVSRRAWPVVLPCAALLVGVSAIVAGEVYPAARAASLPITYLPTDLVGLALSIWAARRSGGFRARRNPWRWIVVSWVLTMVAGAALGAAPADGSSNVLVWIGVAIRLLQVPLLVAGILSFRAERLGRQQRLKLVLDVTTVVGGGFIVVWFFLLGPALYRTGTFTAGSFGALALLAQDLVLVVVVCTVLLRGRGTRANHPLAVLLAGAVVHLGVDLHASSAAVREGTLLTDARQAPIVTLALLAELFLTALAAGLRLREADEDPEAAPAAHPAGPAVVSHLPYLALAIGYGFLLGAVPGNPYPWAGLVAGALVMTAAVTVRQWIALRENHRLATTDLLTGLVNRGRLATELRQALTRPGAAVLLFDLDGFKGINDTHGHETGDRVLVEFAGVLRRAVSGAGTVARLGGDEFAAVVGGPAGAAGAVEMARRIVAEAAGIAVGDAVHGIRTSVGIALAEPGLSSSDALHRADVAMYRAKRAGTHGWAVYAPEETGAEPWRAGAVTVDYRPLTDLSDGRVVAVEARAAERGLGVLEQAAGRPAGGSRLHVPLSALQVRDPGLVADVAALLHRTGLAPDRLVLTVAEEALPTAEPGVLQRLRDLGVRIGVDGVGADWSTLRHLSRLPLDVLILDPGAAGDLTGPLRGAAVAEAVVRLGRELGLRVLVPGEPAPDRANRAGLTAVAGLS